MIQDAFVRQRARQLYWQGYTQFSDARVFTEPGFTKSIVGSFAASIMVLTVDSLRPIILANS